MAIILCACIYLCVDLLKFIYSWVIKWWAQYFIQKAPHCLICDSILAHDWSDLRKSTKSTTKIGGCWTMLWALNFPNMKHNANACNICLTIYIKAHKQDKSINCTDKHWINTMWYIKKSREISSIGIVPHNHVAVNYVPYQRQMWTW